MQAGVAVAAKVLPFNQGLLFNVNIIDFIAFIGIFMIIKCMGFSNKDQISLHQLTIRSLLTCIFNFFVIAEGPSYGIVPSSLP